MILLGLREFLFYSGFALSWLMTANAGPIAHLWAWFFASLAISCALISKERKSLVLQTPLVVVAALSTLLGVLQFTGLADSWPCCVSPSANGDVYANLRQRNQFASLCVIGFAAVLTDARSKDSRSTLWAARFQSLPVQGLLIAWLALGAALSSSRTGALQWFAVCFLVWLWRHSLGKRVAMLMLWGCVCYVVWVMATPWLAQLMGNPSSGLLGRVDDSNAFSRVALWSNVLELIAQKPGLGWGWGSLAYAHYSSEFSGKRFMELLDNAHNLPLHLAVELGLPVALAFCGGVIWLIWRNKPWAETKPERQLAWGILLVIGIHSMVEYPLWYGPFFMTALICVGILCADRVRAWSALARHRLALASSYLAVFLLLATAYVAFDYHRVSQIYLQPQQRSSWYQDDALAAAKKSTLFRNHALFAELNITPLTRETAPQVFALSSAMVKWSPEAAVIEKLIESAVMLQDYDTAMFHWRRYRQAYPKAYEAWRSRNEKLGDLAQRL